MVADAAACAQLVKEYDFDGLRVDTVPEVRHRPRPHCGPTQSLTILSPRAQVAADFWSEFNDEVGVFTIGEVRDAAPRDRLPRRPYRNRRPLPPTLRRCSTVTRATWPRTKARWTPRSRIRCSLCVPADPLRRRPSPSPCSPTGSPATGTRRSGAASGSSRACTSCKTSSKRTPRSRTRLSSAHSCAWPLSRGTRAR